MGLEWKKETAKGDDRKRERKKTTRDSLTSVDGEETCWIRCFWENRRREERGKGVEGLAAVQ